VGHRPFQPHGPQRPGAGSDTDDRLEMAFTCFMPASHRLETINRRHIASYSAYMRPHPITAFVRKPEAQECLMSKTDPQGFRPWREHDSSVEVNQLWPIE